MTMIKNNFHSETQNLELFPLSDKKVELSFTAETISSDGKGRATDNIFIERLWRSVKYEDVYLNAYENGFDLYRGLKKYFIFYNQIRRHTSIENKRPMDIYYAA